MNKRILFIISSLILMSVGSSAPAAARRRPPRRPQKPRRRRTTNLSTAAEGNLEPLQSVTLNFTGSGLVTEVTGERRTER